MTRRKIKVPAGGGGAWASTDQTAFLIQKVNVLLRELNKLEIISMVSTSDIDDGAVTTPKIANKAITDDLTNGHKIQNGVVFPTDTVALGRGYTFVNASSGFDEDQTLPLPTWRYAALLNGDYFVTPNHADFDITGDLTMGADVLLDSSWSAGGNIIHKRNTTTGFGLGVTATRNLIFYISNVVFIITDYVLDKGQFYKVRATYDASAQEVVFYILSNHLETEGANDISYRAHEIARANNTTQTNCSLTGTIPAGLSTNTLDIGIGANPSGGGSFVGYLANVFVAATEMDHNKVLQNVKSCRGFWPLAYGAYDISGREHHATENTFAIPANIYREEPIPDPWNSGGTYIWIRRLPEGLAAAEY